MGKKDKGVQETPQQAAMVQRAQAQMADYKARWLPLQQRMAKQVEELGANDSPTRQRAQGRATTETTARFAKAGGAMEKALTASGAGPGSSRFNLAVTGMANDQAASRGSGMFAADQAIDDAYIQGLGNLAAVGRGEKAMANQGLVNSAMMSGRQAAQDADLSMQEQMGYAQTAGQVAGVGMGQMLNARAPQGVGMIDVNGMFSRGRDGTSQLPSFGSIS